jgi:CheY-like chemotaxis protein
LTTAAKTNFRILLAEDSIDTKDLILEFLSRYQVDTVHVSDGKAVVDMIMATSTNLDSFSLIIMDMQMPLLDGYQAARLLRQKGYVNPIVAVTAHAFEYDRSRCLKAGCSDYISKPIDWKDFEAKLCLLDKKKGAAPRQPPQE